MFLHAIAAFLTLASISSCNSTAHAGVQEQPAPPISPDAEHGALASPLFPPASGDLELTWPAEAGRPSMLDLLLRYVELTGQELAFSNDQSEQTRALLAQDRVPLEASTTVPAAQVQSFVETLLAGQYVLTVGRTEAPRLVFVHSLKSPSRTVVRSQAIHVPSSRAHLLRAHPAVLFTTLVELPNLDVRTLSNSLRSIIVDPNVQTIVPLGPTSLMVTSTGPWVADLVEQLQTLDATHQRTPAAVVHRLVWLAHADAHVVAPLVEQALASARSQRAGADEPDRDRVSPAPTVQPYGPLHALWITCMEAELRELEEIIAQLDIE